LHSIYSHVMSYIGEIAAFGTAICWTLSALFFEQGTKRIGVLGVNFYKVVFAFVFLTITAWIVKGKPFPIDAGPHEWFFLTVSGFIGFVITDIFLFTAYKTIGSRMATLFLAISPAFTALLGYVFLNEVLSVKALLAMALVASGIILAVLSRERIQMSSVAKTLSIRGYIFAFLSSIGQSVGMIFTRQGVKNYDAISGTQIRVMSAIVGFALVSLIFERGKSVTQSPKDSQGMRFTFIGSIFGPFLGVALSLFAMQHTKTGIVSTLIGLTPILIIPPAVLILKQRVKLFEVVGAVIAVAGSALFFM